MFAYTAVTAPLEFTLLAAALLWRNDQWMRSGNAAADSVTTPGQQPAVSGRPALRGATLATGRP
jgi:hypothetical protein